MNNIKKIQLLAILLLILNILAVSAFAADSNLNSEKSANSAELNSNNSAEYVNSSESVNSTESVNPIEAENSKRQILIGTYRTDDYSTAGKINENLQSYMLEYLQEISKYTKWSYKFVNTTPDESLELLKAGKIDLIGPINYSVERAQYLDYAKNEFGFSYGVLAVKDDDTKYAYEDFTNFNGITVGAVGGTLLNDEFENYCEINNISAGIKLFDSEKELLKALSKGNIEAILTHSIQDLSSYRIIAKFSPEKFYFATSKGNEQLLSKLNYASEHIKVENPGFEAELLEKYCNTYIGKAITFTNEEKSFINSGNIIRAAYIENRMPTSYKSDMGKFSGILADLSRIIENNTGLKFEYISAQTLKDCVNLVEKGKADVILGVDNDDEWLENNNIKVTNPLVTSPIFIIANSQAEFDSSKVRFIGITDYSVTARKVANMYYNADTVVYRTARQCFDSLLSGETDLTAGNSYLLHYMLENPKYAKFSVFAVPDKEQKICIGIAGTYDEKLLSILNKAISEIPAADINSITIKNTASQTKLRLSQLISENIGGFILAILTVLVLFASMLLYALSVKNKLKVEKQKILYFDDITGIWNYNKFKLEASELLKRTKNKYVFVYLSIERLRFINETHGYSTGDEVLREMAKILQKYCDSDELYSRVYAGYFSLLIKFDGKDELASRFNRLVEKLSASVSEICDSRVTVIAGVYIITAHDRDVNEIFAKANDARETIKSSYKSTFMFYNKKMFLEVQALIDVDKNMVKALKNNEFVPFLQPKYNLEEDRIVGAEALVRWLPPEKETIYPSEFISYFERTGFIVDLDYYLFKEVCKKINEWISEKKEIFPVSCNFSILHTYESDFADKLFDIASEYYIPPKFLEIEFTESVASENLDNVIDHINRLHSYGFKISLDDFGSGYSSLSLLSKLKVDILKLDKAFLDESVMYSEKSNILSAVVDMAEKLNVEVVCEGVETQEQVNFVKKVGCSIIQGFYYSRALPVLEFEKLVATQSIDILVKCEDID